MTARTLILMRHGKSDYPTGVTDHERPLAARGQREATLAGEWLARDGLDVDVVLCSTATRTRETLQRTEIDAPATFLDEIYGGAPEDIFEALRVHVPADAETVLVIGHEPGMPETATELDPLSYIDRFPTSAFAVVDIGVEWEKIGLTPDPAASLRAMRIPR